MTVTRFGRAVKKPVLYVPAEEVLIDDYASDEHDSVSDSDIYNEDEEGFSSEEDYDDDADENGNLKDFVVDDESESESEEEDA